MILQFISSQGMILHAVCDDSTAMFMVIFRLQHFVKVRKCVGWINREFLLYKANKTQDSEERPGYVV